MSSPAVPDFDWRKIRDWLQEVGFEEWGSVIPENQAEGDRFWTFLNASDFEKVIARIEALPDAGEGMTLAEIASRVGSDPNTVSGALESIVQSEESKGAA